MLLDEFAGPLLATFVSLLLTGFVFGLLGRKLGAWVALAFGAVLLVGCFGEGKLLTGTACLMGALAAEVVLFRRTRVRPPVRDGAAQASRSSQAESETVPLKSGGTVHVVGESHYQKALSRIAGGRRAEGVRLEVIASLVPEPNNRFDRNAIAVHIAGHVVGYLSREDAIEFKPVLDPIVGAGKRATCPAVIVGGWDRGRHDKGSFGVRLGLSRPEDASRAESQAFERSLAKLESAKGPAGRRVALERGLAEIESSELRRRLDFEASRIEVSAVLDKVEALKTPAAKRRHLVEVLERIRKDSVPDEIQTDQIRLLEDALRAIELKSSP